MTRLRALGYGVLVAIVVFYYLAVPVLRDLIGPVVVLPAYVAVAVLAGVVTYHAARFLFGREAAGDVALERSGGAPPSERPEPEVIDEADGGDDLAVDGLIEELEAGREE